MNWSANFLRPKVDRFGEVRRPAPSIAIPANHHVGYLAAMLWTALLVQANADDSVASLVVPDAILYFATSDVAALEAAWNNTGPARLWQSEPMSAFKETWLQSRQFSPKCPVPEWGLSWKQLRTIARGEVCFAIIPTTDCGSGTLLLIDTSGKDKQVVKLLSALKEQYARDGEIVHTSPTVANLSVQKYLLPGILEDGATQRIYFQCAGVFGVTNSEELAEQILKKGRVASSGSLATAQRFQIIQRNCKAAAGEKTGHLSWYFDPWGYEKLTRKTNGESGVGTLTQMKAQGFDVVRALGGLVTFSTERHDIVHHWIVHAVGERQKAAQMLHFVPIDLVQLPKWIPAGVDSVRCIGWNLQSAMTGYGSWFDAEWVEGEEGVFEASLDDIRDDKFGPQVDIRGLLAQQVGPVIEVTKTGGVGQDLRTQRIYAVELKKESLIADAVKNILSDNEAVRTKVGAHMRWVFKDNHDIPVPNLSGCAVGVAGCTLFVANDSALLTQILSPATEALVENSDYDQLRPAIIAAFPDNCISYRIGLTSCGIGPTYEDWRSRGKAFLAALKTGRSSIAIAFTKLPPTEFAQQFLPPSYGFAQEISDGWLMSSYTLRYSKSDQSAQSNAGGR